MRCSCTSSAQGCRNSNCGQILGCWSCQWRASCSPSPLASCTCVDFGVRQNIFGFIAGMTQRIIGDFLPGSDWNVVCGKIITHVVLGRLVRHFASTTAASESRQSCIGCCRSSEHLGLTCRSISHCLLLCSSRLSSATCWRHLLYSWCATIACACLTDGRLPVACLDSLHGRHQRSENQPTCKCARADVDFAGNCGSRIVSHCRFPGRSGDVLLCCCFTSPHRASVAHSRMNSHVQAHACRITMRSLAIHHACPSIVSAAHLPIAMSECRKTHHCTRLPCSCTPRAFLRQRPCGFDVDWSHGLSHDSSSLWCALFCFCFGGIALLVRSAREEKRRSKLSWKGYNDQKAAEVSCLVNRPRLSTVTDCRPKHTTLLEQKQTMASVTHLQDSS